MIDRTYTNGSIYHFKSSERTDHMDTSDMMKLFKKLKESPVLSISEKRDMMESFINSSSRNEMIDVLIMNHRKVISRLA